MNQDCGWTHEILVLEEVNTYKKIVNMFAKRTKQYKIFKILQTGWDENKSCCLEGELKNHKSG